MFQGGIIIIKSSNNEHSIRDLFKCQVEAVLDQFTKAMGIYDRMIEEAHAVQERISQRNLMEMDWKEKAKHDQTFEQANDRILSAQREKNNMLFKMGQFAGNEDHWDAEEALSVSIQAFLRVAKGSITPTQYKRLEKAIDVTLINKTVAELKDYVTGVTNDK